jgi:hypothetical protein
MPRQCATPETVSTAPKRRRRLRFGLRGLIVLVTLAAIVFAPLGMIARRKQRENHAIEALTSIGATVTRQRSKSHVESVLRFLNGDAWSVDFRPVDELITGLTWFGLPSDSYFPNAGESEIADEHVHRVVSGIHQLGDVQRLSINSSQLTDIGLLELRSLPHLNELNLRCPLVTSHGTDALQQKFPKLLILDD